jgi:hypothetical protein
VGTTWDGTCGGGTSLESMIDARDSVVAKQSVVDSEGE